MHFHGTFLEPALKVLKKCWERNNQDLVRKMQISMDQNLVNLCRKSKRKRYYESFFDELKP